MAFRILAVLAPGIGVGVVGIFLMVFERTREPLQLLCNKQSGELEVREFGRK